MAGRGLNIEQILKDLENVKTAEELFAEGLQDNKVEEPVQEETPAQESTTEESVATEEIPAEEPVVAEEPTVTEDKPAEVTETVVTEETITETTEPAEKTAEEIEQEKIAEMQKEAAEWDARGRILARSFISELQKLAYAVEYADEVEKVEEVEKENTEKTASVDPAVKILTELYNRVF